MLENDEQNGDSCTMMLSCSYLGPSQSSRAGHVAGSAGHWQPDQLSGGDHSCGACHPRLESRDNIKKIAVKWMESSPRYGNWMKMDENGWILQKVI
jgi:hypothetical protein